MANVTVKKISVVAFVLLAMVKKIQKTLGKDKGVNKLITLPCDVSDLSELFALIQEQSEFFYTPVL